MSYEKKYEKNMYIYDACDRLKRTEGMHSVCSLIGKDEVTFGYHYESPETRGSVELKGKKNQPGLLELLSNCTTGKRPRLEVTVSAETEKELKKVYSVVKWALIF